MALTESAREKKTFDVQEQDLLIDRGDIPRILDRTQDYRLDGTYVDYDSFDVVEGILDSSQELVDKYSELAISSLEDLGSFPARTVGASNINLDLPDPPPISDLDAVKPSRPSYDVPDVGSPPDLRGDIQSPVFQTIDRPDIEYPEEPTRELNWSELPYMSDLLDSITSSISYVITNGGAGLDADYEQAVWDRAVARLELAHLEKYEEAENYYASKGHVAPPGALVSRLNMLNLYKEEQEGLISSDIAAKMLELAHEHKKFNLDLGVRLEQLTMQQKNEVENRALEAEKLTITLLYEKYKVAMDGIMNKVEIYKADIAAEGTRVESIAAANKSLTDTLSAETDAWIARIQAEFGIIEEIIKMYVAEMGGYEAEVRAGGIRIGALIDRYKAEVGAEEVQGQISLGEYEQLVKYALGEIELKLGSQKEAGRIAAQVASAALSSFNASASVSNSASRSRSFNEGRSVSTQNSFSRTIGNQLSVQYGMSDDAQDSYSEYRQFSYSASTTP